MGTTVYGDTEPTPVNVGQDYQYKVPVDRDGPMADVELQGEVTAVLTDCSLYCDTELSPERAKATDYYQGKPFGNEENGRSQAISTDVRDSITGIVPPLLRVFFGSERTVEFRPRGQAVGLGPIDADRLKQQTAMAAQATDYVEYVFKELNNGFLQTHSVLKDGLIRKLGIFKWGWDSSKTTKAYRLDNVTSEQLEALGQDPEVEINRVTPMAEAEQTTEHPGRSRRYGDGVSRDDMSPHPYGTSDHDAPFGVSPSEEEPAKEGVREPADRASRLDGMPPEYMAAANNPDAATGENVQRSMAAPAAAAAPDLYSVEFTRRIEEGVPRVWTLPPEEFLFSREARSLEDAICIAHRTHKTRGELIAMGVSEKDIDEHGGEDMSLRNNEEEIARRTDQVFLQGASLDVESGPENVKVLYCEAYITVDYDGDGVAELRRICTLGPTYHVIENEPTDERPFSVFCADPEPHVLLGLSWADRTLDVQKIKSMVLRALLDSAALAVFPRVTYVEGQANVNDLLNTEIGGLVRTRMPNAVTPLTMPFLGGEMLPIFGYLDEVIERRTGQNKGVMGLDADALQSTDKEGVQAAITASQSQQDLLARLFAEMALKPLFKGLLRLLCKYQPKAQVVRLRNQWVNVDPRAWDATMDVQVNVGLGTGDVDRKIAVLVQVATHQAQILEQYGPSNPLVSLAQLRNTLAQILELRGFKDTTAYYKMVDPNWQPPPQPPKQSPEEMMAQAQIQIEQMKTERELAIKEAELQLKQKTAEQDYALAVRKAADDFVLRRYQIDAQFHANYTQQQIDADAGAEERWLTGVETAHGMALKANQQQHEQALAEDAQEHEQQMAEQQGAQPQDSTGSDGSNQ